MKKQGLIIANWKMNFGVQEAEQFFKEFLALYPKEVQHQVIIAPQAPLLSLAISHQSQFHQLSIAAQNCATEEKGAYTGEISATCLQSLGVRAVLLGHSERRHYFAENESQLSKKIEQALSQQLKVIYCVGETLDQRKGGQLEQVLSQQLTALNILESLSSSNWDKIVIAYEPVWAIGTGQVATPAQVQEVHLYLQKCFEKMFKRPSPPILYGGSVNASNAQELFKLPAVAGFLVGGASLKVPDFCTILSVQ